MIKTNLLALLFGLLLFGCAKDEELVLEDLEEEDDLEVPMDDEFLPIAITPCNVGELNILGAWQFEQRWYNNNTDLPIECCQILTFFGSFTQTASACGGQFTIDDNLGTVEGNFSIDILNNLIQFDFTDRFLVYEYLIDEDIMNFRYLDDGIEIIEVWERQ
ncbi:MAG: hypothetical protein AAF598_19735 [Bacteroidota bacterium]